MKYLVITLLVASSLLSCKNSKVKGKNGVTYDNAVEYNDFIVNRQTTLMKKVVDFGKTAGVSVEAAKDSLKVYARQAGTMLNEIKGMPPFKNDSTLRDAAVESFTFYKRIFEKDYLDILELYSKGDAKTEEDIAATDEIIARITKDEADLDGPFQQAQKDFAKKNKIELRNTTEQKSLQKEIDEIGKEN